MDYTVIYTIGVIAAVIGLTALVTYLRKNNIVTKEDLQIVEQLFNLTNAIVDELNLKHEEKIMQISQIVMSALSYAIKINSDEVSIVAAATEEAYLICTDLGIELTESRKVIISQLIQLGLRNRYKQAVDGKYVRTIKSI